MSLLHSNKLYNMNFSMYELFNCEICYLINEQFLTQNSTHIVLNCVQVICKDANWVF